MYIAPTPQQLRWHRAEVGVFFHFGVNTFTEREWGDGRESPAVFDPESFDAAQWAEAAQSFGARYVILTAKHHDGFCLWPTATTDHSVASSPWRDGRGDVVAEVLRACRDAGLEVGLYLSPWDRHQPRYADAAAYDDFYLQQLTELCTRYGELFEIWFDGAGSLGRRYAWDRWMAVVEQHQPEAMVFNAGRPTIRWVGNEDGLATDPVRYQVRLSELAENEHRVDPVATELYLPPECDVSIRPGWFHHPSERPKSTEQLLEIYHRSVGLGANLLMNLPPDPRGLIPDSDLRAIEDYRTSLDRLYRPLDAHLRPDGRDAYRLDFRTAVPTDRISVLEELSRGQRISRLRLFDGDERIAEVASVGQRRIITFGPRTVDELRIEIDGSDAALVGAVGYRSAVSN